MSSYRFWLTIQKPQTRAVWDMYIMPGGVKGYDNNLGFYQRKSNGSR